MTDGDRRHRGARRRFDSRRRARQLASALQAGVVVSQVLYGLRSPRGPAATRALLLALVSASAAEAAAARGVRRGGGSLASAAVTGFAAELVGVRTGFPFGRYSYSGRLGPRVGGVPLLAAGAWAAMARPAWVTAGWVSAKPARRVPVAAGALMAWDVFLDPRMAREGYWTWQSHGRYEGIPATNFLGWLITGAVAFAVIARLDPAAPGPEDDGALFQYSWTWLGESFANGVLWDRRATAVAGAGAMGAIALPALGRRLAAS